MGELENAEVARGVLHGMILLLHWQSIAKPYSPHFLNLIDAAVVED